MTSIIWPLTNTFHSNEITKAELTNLKPTETECFLKNPNAENQINLNLEEIWTQDFFKNEETIKTSHLHSDYSVLS